jgi:CubicO group peptidase (beta-lactamase class C family)
MLEAYVDSGRVGGVVAVIARNGQVGYEQTVGWMDVERRVPMKRDAIFRIYSMTKPVLAVAVMRLVERGQLGLEDPVSRYIPAFAHVKVFAGGSADGPVLEEPDSVMTVRHLLTHTAGLGYGLHETPVDTLYRRAELFDAARTLGQFTDSIARLPLYFAPGTRFHYSAAIDVVGRVIEVASGRPLDHFLEEEILGPLGMRDTSFRLRDDMAGRVAVLYARGPNGVLTEAVDDLSAMYEPDARFFWGGGGLLSTADDYLRFAQTLLNGGELDGRRILSAASVALIMRNHLPVALTPLSGAVAGAACCSGVACRMYPS